MHVERMSGEDRNASLNGKKDENGMIIDRGVIALTQLKTAEDLKALMERLQVARAERS